MQLQEILTSLILASLRLIWNSSITLCKFLWLSKFIFTLGISDPHSERSSSILTTEKKTQHKYSASHFKCLKINPHQVINQRCSPASLLPSLEGPEQTSCWPLLLSSWGLPVRISVRASGSACFSNAWGYLGPCHHRSPSSSGLMQAADSGSRQESRMGWGTA